MINVTIITTKGCRHCTKAINTMNILKQTYPLIITEYDAESLQGQDLIRKHGILSSPGILINDKLFSMGGSGEEQLSNRFDELL